ncbi:MAG: histone deacetylase family protein [Salaquimonas sp.]|jgi:acetoin utilization deacetylase AcuC-like enzyme|nr:histone deacetylase family protein [Salaquimonas sp.]
MKTIYSPRHKGHSGHTELAEGVVVPGFEKPERAEIIRARMEETGLGPVVAPVSHDLARAKRVHDAGYVEFLGRAWEMWRAEGRDAPVAMPFVFPARGLRADVPPDHVDGLLGYYSFDAGANFVAGTWDAIQSSFDTALTAASLVHSGERSAFALCRPPGHHAGSMTMGGYCYINNAAVAAQWLLDEGANRISILDIDYHHGNGTQEIFYRRSDVQLINIHADPKEEYPYFLGHADEEGEGDGEGFNHNYPLPFGTEWARWCEVLEEARAKIAAYAPDVLVVSLGVDTYEGDPISKFRLQSEHYPQIGERIARLNLPTLFVMEGGYAVEAIGVNVVGVLSGFEGG